MKVVISDCLLMFSLTAFVKKNCKVNRNLKEYWNTKENMNFSRKQQKRNMKLNLENRLSWKREIEVEKNLETQDNWVTEMFFNENKWHYVLNAKNQMKQKTKRFLFGKQRLRLENLLLENIFKFLIYYNW